MTFVSKIHPCKQLPTKVILVISFNNMLIENNKKQTTAFQFDLDLCKQYNPPVVAASVLRNLLVMLLQKQHPHRLNCLL